MGNKSDKQTDRKILEETASVTIHYFCYFNIRLLAKNIIVFIKKLVQNQGAILTNYLKILQNFYSKKNNERILFNNKSKIKFIRLLKA